MYISTMKYSANVVQDEKVNKVHTFMYVSEQIFFFSPLNRAW